MRTRWRTSSYSGGNGGACIEVTSQDDSGRILVRDSKNRQGAALRFTPAAWHAFTRRVKAAQPLPDLAHDHGFAARSLR